MESFLARPRKFNWVLRGAAKFVIGCVLLWFFLAIHGTGIPATDDWDQLFDTVVLMNILIAGTAGAYLFISGLSNILRWALGNEAFGWD